MSFLTSLPPHGPARDAAILGAIHTGNLDEPDWVDVQCGPVTLTVSADYLKIDGSRIPMAAYVAQVAVDSLGALLPTPKVVDAIEAAARERGRFIPFVPWPRWQDNSQLETSTIEWREANIGEVPRGTLVAGCLKDVVIAARLASMLDRVLIYGGRYANGKRVQDLQTTSTAHHAGFDSGYGAGTRAIRDRCTVNGQPDSVSAILRDPKRAAWLSYDGPLTVLRYPAKTTPVVVTPAPTWTLPEGATLRRGHRGPLVAELQRRLSGAGFVVTNDGLFGGQTEAAVIELQSERGLVADGVVGPATRKTLGWGEEEEEDTDPGDPYAHDFDVASAPSPLSDAERIASFGSFQWVAAPRPDEPSAIKILGTWVGDNFTTITVPQLVGISGAPSGRVFCNRRAAPTILRFFANVEKAGKKHLILSFDGCTNFRRVRGGESLSNHCWGTDIDVNARWNVRGTRGAPQGARGSLVELFPIAVDSGMGLGINWPTPDPHHLGVLAPE